MLSLRSLQTLLIALIFTSGLSCKTIDTILTKDNLLTTADCTARNVLRRGPEIYDKIVQIYTEGTDTERRLLELVEDVGLPTGLEIIACVSGQFAMSVDQDVAIGASVDPAIMTAQERARQWIEENVENQDAPFDPPLEEIVATDEDS